ncbi:flocculation protein FLO11-like isoform X2 [Cottoperca gobio]|uniref:Flocculation protein FLO11-like isoform X2 n=1 Tax=Cottoperca gobio TaxID=56716 RepID=A0A6J2Q419_COTGO|nr:flocculation protein FLO11-like isoform X2 [Cottoperca gobio]
MERSSTLGPAPRSEGEWDTDSCLSMETKPFLGRTGQAVEAFDKLFRVLYATSSSVDLRQATTEPEPEQEPIRQPAAVAPLSADMARKLYSPKYALAALGNPSTAPSAGLKETQNTDDSKNPGTKKRRGRRASQEAIQEAPPLHPGLIDLEKACMMSYLPTWPEPDPASDVIGFINIRDTRKPNQSHLQRSEMYESSQAIRFSSLFSKPQETLLDVAKPRDFTAQHKEMNRIQPARDKTKAEESVVGRAQSTQLQTGPGDTTKILNTGTKQHSNIPTKQDANQNSTPHLNSHKPVQSSSEASTPETGRPSHSSQTVTTLPGTNTKKEAETNSDTQHAALYRTHALELCSRQASHLRSPADTNSNTEPYTPTKTKLPQTDSHTQPQNVFSTPPLTSSSTTLNPPLPSSSASPSFTSTPPIPKPRTVQLFFKGDVTDNGQNLPEFRVVPMAETSKGSLVVRNEPAVETGVQTLPEKVSKTVPELQNNRESKTGTQLNAKETLNIGESPKKKKSGTSQETKNGEAVGRHEKAGMQLETGNKAKSDVVIADAPKAENVTIQEIIPKVVEPKALMSIDGVATVQADIKAPKRVPTGCEVSELPNEKSENVTEHKRYLARAHVPQRISYSELPPQDNNALESVDSLKAPTHTPVSATHISKDSASDSTHTDILSHGYPPALRTDSLPNTSKHNTHNTIQEPISKARGSTHTPERPLHLHLSEINTPDFRSRTPEREPRSLTALVRTPTPDIFLPRTPTSDSRTPTSDSRTPTPDSRTHTPDGYVTPRADSALSTASEEYYECSGSPLHDPVFERVVLRKHGTTEDHVSFAHTNTPHATSPAYINSNTCAATLGITYRNTSSSETQTLSEPARVSSSSEKWGEMREEKANDENGREEDEKGRTEDDYQGTERRASEEAKRTANHFKHGKDLTETKDKNKEAQAPKRKKLLIQFAAERQDDGGGTPGESTNEPKRSPTGDLQPTKERRDRPQSTDGQKLLHSPLKTVRGQKQESGGSFSFRPPRPTRPLSPNWALGPRPRGDRQLNQAESKMLLNNTLSPFRPPPPVNARQRQAEISHSQQGRTSVGQSQDQHPKPQSSSLFTHFEQRGAAPYSLPGRDGITAGSAVAGRRKVSIQLQFQQTVQP